MKISNVVCGILLMSVWACSSEKQTPVENKKPIEGTWELVSGTTIEGKDTIQTDYTKNQRSIKIINQTHFAFLRHDLTQGKDSTTALYVAGGGKYTLEGETYTEYLEYLNFRDWENKVFTFKVSVKNDTLIQEGVEKIEKLNVNRYIIEKYIKTQK